MFQQLLKTLPGNKYNIRNSSSIHTSLSTQEQSPNLNYRNISAIKDDTWNNPHQVKEENHEMKRVQSLKTPDFLDKIENMGMSIKELQQDSERMCLQGNGSGDDNEYESQILSINDMMREQDNPMIISHINNNYRNSTDRLMFIRIRNFVSELRQIHQELGEYMEDQKTIMQYFQEKLCLEIQDFCIQYRNMVALSFSKSQSVEELKSNASNLERQLRQKNQDYQILARQLSDLKNNLEKEQQKNIILRKTSIKKLDDNQSKLSFTTQRSSPCLTCRNTQAKLQSIKNQLRQNEEQVQKLLIDNERLQEYIFDLEQKVVGIDLEVEKRLKENTKLIDDFKINKINVNNKQCQSQQNQILSQQIIVLQQKCKRLEDFGLEELQLTSKQKNIEENINNLERRETILKNQNAKVKEQQQINYEREHQILVAEQNLSKKINDLRQKQLQLSQWETELTKKANEVHQIRKDNSQNKQLINDTIYRLNSGEELNNSDQISLKSFGRNKNNHLESKLQGSPSSEQNINNYLQTPNYGTRFNDQIYLDQQQLSSNKNRVHHIPIRDHYEYEVREASYNRPQRGVDRESRLNSILKNDSKRVIDSAYTPRSREKGLTESLSKKYVGAASHYRDSRQTSPYRNANDNRSRPQQNAAAFRATSKNSRSSANKGIHYTLQNSNVNRQHMPNNIRMQPQLSGLGSKLQRLRQQIKKQINSIK